MSIKQQDVILIDGTRHTLLSAWPETDPIPADAMMHVEEVNPATQAVTRKTLYISQHKVEETGDTARPSFGTPGVDAPVEVPAEDQAEDDDVHPNQVTLEDALTATPAVEDVPAE